MRSKFTGPKILRRWRQQQIPAVKMADVGRAIGFKNGSYVQKYEAGERLLPIPRLVRLSEHTGIPLLELAHPSQLRELELYQKAGQMAARPTEGAA
jgi:hypothetical protein